MPVDKSPKDDTRIQLNTKLIFSENMKKVQNFEEINFEEFLQKCDRWATSDGAKSSKIAVTKQALGNARGKWYEWLITLGYWHWVFSQEEPNFILAQLPNINSFDSTNLFKLEVVNSISKFKEKLLQKNVTLVTSNPDFVIIKSNPLEHKLFTSAADIKAQIMNLDEMSEFFSNFVGTCDITDVLGYLAVKSSMRPDRRLQIAHEGSIFKALSKNISLTINEKEFIPNFFAFTIKTTGKDQQALKTAATHSIAENASNPIRAVDEVYNVNNYTELSDAFLSIQQKLR